MPLRRITNHLREIRSSKGLSGYDLQILSKIPAQEIYRIERGLTKPQIYQKHLIADALNASVQKVFPTNLERNQEVIKI
jgi:transcriptional regulator with XRE-family HTH domain